MTCMGQIVIRDGEVLHAAPPDYSELDYAPFGARLPPAQTSAEAAAVTTNGHSNGDAEREQVCLTQNPSRVGLAHGVGHVGRWLPPAQTAAEAAAVTTNGHS